jgi:hypothetical protein
MEVHHHPNVEKKSFKEYLLEGLMIFIAVTMGFFAETIREGVSEHNHAKVFAASMIKDLQADTTELGPYISYFSYAVRNTDTLMQLLAKSEPRNIPSGKLYWYGLWGGAHRYFVPNDATFEQMKNSGALNYFEKGLAADVAKYARLCRLIQDDADDNREIYTEVRKCRAKLFDFRYNDIANNVVIANRKNFDQARIDSFITSNPPVLSYDKALFNEYVEMVRSRFMSSTIADARSLSDQASKLIQELKSTYAFEDD